MLTKKWEIFQWVSLISGSGEGVERFQDTYKLVTNKLSVNSVLQDHMIGMIFI